MLTESLNIYVIDKDGNKVTFPNVEGMQPAIVDVNLNRERMAGAPTNTSTLMYPVCLDSYWTKKEFIEIGGERFYVKQVPTSEKNTEDARYKHEITFVSERDILENVFFFDCVTQDTSSQISDKPRTNTTDFSFYGDLNELVQRLNDSLSYSKIYDPKGVNGFCIVIDDDVEIGEAKEVSITDAYFATAMQEIYNVFEVPYYWVGKVCHVGYQENEITEPFEYGSGNGLISVQKTNAEFRLINRITGQGSADNIPYYYPNSDPNGTAIFETENFDKNLVSQISLAKVFQYTTDIYGLDITLCKNKQETYSANLLSFDNYLTKVKDRALNDQHGEFTFDGVSKDIAPKVTNLTFRGFYGNYSYKAEIPGRPGATATKKVGADFMWCYLVYDMNAIGTKTKIDFSNIQFVAKINKAYKGSGGDSATSINIPNVTFSYDYAYYVGGLETPMSKEDVMDKIKHRNDDNTGNSQEIFGAAIDGMSSYRESSSRVCNYILSQKHSILIECCVTCDFKDAKDIVLDVSIEPQGELSFVYDVGEQMFIALPSGKTKPLSESGISIKSTDNIPFATVDYKYDGENWLADDLISAGSNAAKIKISGRDFINPISKLMPSIFRNTKGAERFYNAKNETYLDDNGEYYSFNNPYVPSEPLEGKQDFEDIKPTINGITNENGELFGEIAAVAFDDTDSDDLSIEDAKDANTNTATPVHPYFYVKLHKFSGENGFNLFKQGLAQGAMTFNFITGSCAGCSFKVQVSEGKQVDNHYEFKNLVQVDEHGNIVAGDSGDKINASNPIASQQDTMNNSVWIALEKDNSTFGVLMPNATNNYRPQGKTELREGDKFVITNILLPTQYITAAEKRLDAALVKYMSENNDEKFTFSIKFSRIYLQEHPEIAEKINENTKLHVKYNNVDYPLYVSSYSRKSDDNILDEISVELSEKLTIAQNKSKEQMDSIMGNVNEQINNAINGSNGGGSTISAADINEIKTSLNNKLSRVSDDTANGKITFQSGANFGAFTSGTLGTGGNIDYRGNAELDSLFIRRFLSVPKFVFNQVDVTASEQWNTNAYGTIESVDTEKQQITLRLESNEYGLLMVGDICRGIFADIENAYGSDKNEEGSLDDCGFAVHRGFFTTYFYVKRIITNQRGKFVFEYGKRSDVTPDPCAFMDFAQYGNFTDESRQSSMYFSSRGKTYTEVLDGVKTWDIQPANRAARFGWLGNLTLEKKDGTTITLKDGNGLYVQKNIYFGGTVEHLSGLKEVDDLAELAVNYDVTLSQYQSVITVDDMGNVINGLYTEDEAKTTKQYRISTAVFVRKGTQILLEEDSKTEVVTEGHYRLHVVSEDCDVEVRNSTVFVKGIRNIKDGVSGTEDDATFDYDTMRRMSDATVLVVVDLEGKTTKTVEMPIRIQHDSLPFMVCDISNENASVSWNTKAKKYLGLPIKATVNLMYHNEPWLISECKVVSGVPEGLTATVALNENGKSYDITIDGNPADDTLPQVSNIALTVVGRYAGANYEYTKTLTISKSADNVIYEIVPSSDSIVIDKDDKMSASYLTCDIYATSSDDKRYKLDKLPEGFTLKYGIDTDVPTTAMSINGTVNVSSGNNQVVFALYDKSGNVLDKESVPLLAYGKDGKGIEYVFKRTTDDEIPSISTPSDWATNTEYQRQDKEYVPTGWTDDPVGVNEQYLYEWVATRKSVNGVWQPFGEVSEYAHFGKHAARVTVTDNIVTIPTDSLGNALTSFSEDINFSLLVDGLACSIDSISTSDSLDNASCVINKDYGRVQISCNDNAALGKSAQTLNFKVVGTLNGASYQDSVTIKVIPNVTGEDGDGYEYIYYLSETEQPSLAAPVRSGGNLTSGWTEDVPPLTETQRYIYVAWRRGEIGADGVFSTPKLFIYKAKDGEDGNSVSDIKNYYRANTSPTAAPTSGWKASASESGFSSTNKYLWNYEEVFYSKTSSKTTTPRVIAVWGEKGNTGISVAGIEEQYALSTSNTNVTGSWSSSIPTLTPTNKYLWNRERTKFDDGTYSAWSTPVIVGVYGDKGDPGRGVASVNTFYALHTSLSATPSDELFKYDDLSDIVISSNARAYVWSADKVTYSEGDPEFTGKYCIGKCSDLTSVSEQYGTSSSKASEPTTWSDTYPQDIPSGNYIWTRDKITWKDGSVTYSAAQLSGQIPVSISSIENYYNVTATSTTAPEKWLPNSPAVTEEEPFLWRKMVITYTNRTTKTDISLIGAKGEKGVDGTSVEYIYKLRTTESVPATPSTSQEDDYVPTGWSDDPQGVTSTNKYEYVSSRTKTNGVWSAFSTPSLWAKYSEDGNSVSDIKNYYRANTSPTAAPTSGWKASASESGFSSTNKYLWNYEEVFYSKTGSKKTTPRVIAVWGEKGNTGISVAGIEEQYALSTSNTNVTGSWSSSIPTLTATNKYLWNRERTTFDDGTYSAWSTPVIIGVYGDTGVGEVTAYCRSAIAPTIVPTVTSRDVFVNANPSANLGASLTHNNPANGSSIFTDGWDSIKSAATLNSFWRKAIPDAAVLNNVKANVDNSGGYWENFTLDGYGWWKSPKITNSETCMMKIKFTTTQSNQVVTFVIRASSEENYDFGIIGKLDTEGVSSYTAKVSGSNEIYIPILVPIADNHHIWVAYTKDGSRDYYNDCCYVRIATDELHQIKGIADGETIKWETISEIKATKGDTGYGCVMRTSLWAANKEYVNQSNEEGDGVKYIDIVYVEDSSANEGYRLYECRMTHTSSTTLTYKDKNHWREFADFNPIYTPLIVAKNAVFKFAQGQQFNIADGDTVWGSFRHVSNSGDLALWLGATSGADGSTASFSVTKGGKLTATNAVIKGEITASSGSITGNMDVTGSLTVGSGSTALTIKNNSNQGQITTSNGNGIYVTDSKVYLKGETNFDSMRCLGLNSTVYSLINSQQITVTYGTTQSFNVTVSIAGGLAMILKGLPTTKPSATGQVWRDGESLKIVV